MPQNTNQSTIITSIITDLSNLCKKLSSQFIKVSHQFPTRFSLYQEPFQFSRKFMFYLMKYYIKKLMIHQFFLTYTNCIQRYHFFNNSIFTQIFVDLKMHTLIVYLIMKIKRSNLLNILFVFFYKNQIQKITMKTLLPIKDADNKQHVIFITMCFCNKTQCTQTNCTQKPSICSRTLQENKQSVLPTGQFQIYVVGHATSKLPNSKKGVIINKIKDYSGQHKPQEMVEESSNPQNHTSDLKVNSQSTAYFQDTHNHMSAINIKAINIHTLLSIMILTCNLKR